MVQPSILQTVVDQVASKLDITDIKVIQYAQDRYRLLQARIQIGQIISKIDSAECRAAVLLEESERKHGGKKLNWNTIGKAIGVKKVSVLQQLQLMIGNYLQPQPQQHQRQTSVNPAKSTTRLSTASTDGIEGGGRKLRTRTMTVNYSDTAVSLSGAGCTVVVKYKPMILPQLIIRLAYFCHYGTQRAVEQLLHDMYNYQNDDNDDNAILDRQGHLHDLQRFAAAYEAAALYYVVNNNRNNMVGTEAEVYIDGDDEEDDSKQNNVKKRKLTRNEREMDEAIVEGDDAMTIDDSTIATAKSDKKKNESTASRQQLTLDDLLQASSEYTLLELKQVIPRVKELAQKIESSKKKKQQKQQRQKSSKIHNVSNTSKTLDTTIRTTSRNKSTHAHDDKTKVLDNKNSYNNSNEMSREERKNSILIKVLEEENGGSSTMSKSQALAQAADKILKKHGLLLE